MTKAIVASILAAVSLVGASELIDTLAPEASKVTIDHNLNTIYTLAYADSALAGGNMQKALSTQAEALSTEGYTYSVEADGSIVGRNDWTCRRLVIGDFLTITDC